MRQAAKRALEGLLCAAGLPARARRRRAGRSLVLAYHNVVPEGERATGDASLHVSQAGFARQLDRLGETHQVVSLEDALRPPEGGKPRVALTFDDAYRGAVTAGVRELERRGFPATFFVAPAFLGGRTFWWDDLAGGPDGTLDAGTRDHVLGSLAGRDEAARAWARSRSTGGAPAESAPGPSRPAIWHQQCASEEELERIAEGPGITLASHSWSHPNLTALDGDELEDQLRRPLHWLKDRFPGRSRPFLAYPYGVGARHVEAAAERAGYAAAFVIGGGWLPPRGPSNPFGLPRMNVPAGLSERGFELRVSGVLRP